MTTQQTTPEAPAAPAEPTLEELAATLYKPDATEAPAEAAVEGEPTKDDKAEPKPDPKAERVAARITSAKRAELRAAQEREQLRAKEAEIAKREAELKEREELARLIEEDPVKYFELKKLGPDAIRTHLEKIAGTFKPEAVAERRLTKLEAELEAAKKAQEEKEKAARQSTSAEEQKRAIEAASDRFVAVVAKNAEKFPNLTKEWDEKEAVAEAFSALNEVVGRDREGKSITRAEAYKAQFGDYPDDETVAEFLDMRAKAKAEAREKEKSGWRRKEKSADRDPSDGDDDGETKVAQPVRGSNPRTLANRASSERASTPKQWTQEHADEASLRILESALRR